jgi:hypothetical protein
VLDVVQLAAQRLPFPPHILQRRPVLLLHAIEHGEAILDFLQPRRRRIDGRGIGPQEERQILQLRFHGGP